MEFKVMRIGTIKVKMFDMIVKALGNVRHVLELEKKIDFVKLIGFFRLCILYSIYAGVMKVIEGGLVVTKWEKTFENFYTLIGLTVKGGSLCWRKSKEELLVKKSYKKDDHGLNKIKYIENVIDSVGKPSSTEKLGWLDFVGYG